MNEAVAFPFEAILGKTHRREFQRGKKRHACGAESVFAERE
jgi:hypothetical protein